ncbi:MAG: hypothetical protein Q9177_005192 [Variospora cf. flavescens]
MRHQPLEILGWGSVGIVWGVTKTIAVKRLKTLTKDDEPRNEHLVFDLLDKYPSCPNIVQSFHRTPSAIFLHRMTGGTLDQRLRGLQTRDPVRHLVIQVHTQQPIQLVWRWMAELTDAIAWLEKLGLVHGDLRPPNLLLDFDDHLKVSDFDSTVTTGEACEGLPPPWARVIGDEGAGKRGTFGYHGPRTEQFAIGSIIYTITRGFEPYEDQSLGEDHGPMVVNLLQAKVFPTTDNNEIDAIIRKCWDGTYSSIQDLHSEVMLIDPAISTMMAKPMDADEHINAKQKCIQLVEEGILKEAPHLTDMM